jgi:hypothetical protein
MERHHIHGPPDIRHAVDARRGNEGRAGIATALPAACTNVENHHAVAPPALANRPALHPTGSEDHDRERVVVERAVGNVEDGDPYAAQVIGTRDRRAKAVLGNVQRWHGLVHCAQARPTADVGA